MNTQEILSIVALSLLGLCFLCGLAKMAMKKDSDKKNCDKACSMAIFAAVVLVGVSQLLTETEKYCGNFQEAAGQDSCGGIGTGGVPFCVDSDGNKIKDSAGNITQCSGDSTGPGGLPRGMAPFCGRGQSGGSDISSSCCC
jgi:hypothetical protein